MNAYVDETPRPARTSRLFRLDPGVLDSGSSRGSRRVQRSRESRRAGDALREIRRRADAPEANLMPAIEEAVRARCTVGEICNVLRDAWGESPPADDVLTQRHPMQIREPIPINVVVASSASTAMTAERR